MRHNHNNHRLTAEATAAATILVVLGTFVTPAGHVAAQTTSHYVKFCGSGYYATRNNSGLYTYWYYQIYCDYEYINGILKYEYYDYYFWYNYYSFNGPWAYCCHQSYLVATFNNI